MASTDKIKSWSEGRLSSEFAEIFEMKRLQVRNRFQESVAEMRRERLAIKVHAAQGVCSAVFVIRGGYEERKKKKRGI